jgi:hypothetical protein
LAVLLGACTARSSPFATDDSHGLRIAALTARLPGVIAATASVRPLDFIFCKKVSA